MSCLIFQYPLIGSNLCNAHSTERTIGHICTFSTLSSGRTSATLEAGKDGITASDFQYPLIGSNLCNKPLTAYEGVQIHLSVPSHRVEPLQLSRHKSIITLLLVFQYPLIGSNLCNFDPSGNNPPLYLFQYPLIGSNLCNVVVERPWNHCTRLSVPSHRVEPLQPCNGWL